LEQWWLRIVRTLGIPVVYTVHNVLPQDSGERHAATYRRIYRLADRLICHDREAASRLVAQFQVDAERISIVPHGLLLEDMCSTRDQARQRLGVAPAECLVLWQGIVRPYKGLSFLMKTWQQVCERNGTARLAIVGAADRSLAEALKTEAHDLGIQERVRLELRFVPVNELADFYEAADILVYPYRTITTSGALMTGIARGKAVIATALPAFEQILRHDDNALLISYGDIAQFTAALVRLIDDPALRHHLGARLRNGQLPQWADIARSTCACYESALCAGPKHVPAPVYK
jgi:glycosyltransferase involved in cell wall biosynthesis